MASMKQEKKSRVSSNSRNSMCYGERWYMQNMVGLRKESCRGVSDPRTSSEGTRNQIRRGWSGGPCSHFIMQTRDENIDALLDTTLVLFSSCIYSEATEGQNQRQRCS